MCGSRMLRARNFHVTPRSLLRADHTVYAVGERKMIDKGGLPLLGVEEGLRLIEVLARRGHGFFSLVHEGSALLGSGSQNSVA